MINYELRTYPELWEKAWNLVSEAHPMKCVCGRLCTGLHEYQCKYFYKSVKRKYESLQKKQNKEYTKCVE